MQMACVGSGVELSTGAVRRGIGGHRQRHLLLVQGTIVLTLSGQQRAVTIIPLGTDVCARLSVEGTIPQALPVQSAGWAGPACLPR